MFSLHGADALAPAAPPPLLLTEYLRARVSPSPSPPPSPSPSPSPSPPSRRAYFTRCLVEQHDCRAVDWAVEQRSHQRLRKAQEETGKGAESERERVPTAHRDEQGSDELGAFLMSGKAGIGIAGHQCAAVCEREQGPVVTASSGCRRVYAGSIFLIVEQLLRLVRSGAF